MRKGTQQAPPLLSEVGTKTGHVSTGEIPWTEEPVGLQSLGLQRIGHDRHTRRARAAKLPYALLISHETRASSYWASASSGSASRSSRERRLLLHGRCSVNVCRAAPRHRQDGAVLGSRAVFLSPSPQPASHCTCILCSPPAHAPWAETLVPTNASRETHVRRRCCASLRPLSTCSCSALRGVCGSTSHHHRPASASLAHKQGNTEHHCRELSGRVPGQTCPAAAGEGPAKAVVGPVPASGVDAVPLDGWGWSSRHGERPHCASIRLFNTAVLDSLPLLAHSTSLLSIFLSFVFLFVVLEVETAPSIPRSCPWWSGNILQ